MFPSQPWAAAGLRRGRRGWRSPWSHQTKNKTGSPSMGEGPHEGFSPLGQAHPRQFFENHPKGSDLKGLFVLSSLCQVVSSPQTPFSFCLKSSCVTESHTPLPPSHTPLPPSHTPAAPLPLLSPQMRPCFPNNQVGSSGLEISWLGFQEDKGEE